MSARTVAVFFFVISFSAGVSALPFSEAVEKVKSARSVAVFVGTFDPIHLGHQIIIESVAQKADIDLVLVVPNNLTLHKPKASPYQRRLALLEHLYRDSEHVIYPDPSMAVVTVHRPHDSQKGFFSTLIGSRFSAANALLAEMRRLNRGLIVVGVIGTDVLEKPYLRLINGLGFRGFARYLVPVWVDAGPKGRTLRSAIFGKSVEPLELAGMPRISSTDIRKSLADGSWPAVLDDRLRPLYGDRFFAKSETTHALSRCSTSFGQ